MTNLSATFSPELADLTIYVLDVAEGEKMPRKGAPASPVQTCWLSTRSISLLMSAHRWK